MLTHKSTFLRILIGVLATGVFLVYFSPTPNNLARKITKMTSTNSKDPIPGLVVTLAQIPDANPPAIRATVTNNNPHPISVLDYGSPLDKASIPLGHAEFAPSSGGDGQPIEYDHIMLRRIWPPREDAITEIAGNGGTVSAEIPLRPAHVPYKQLGDKFTVQLCGEWMAVFDLRKSQVIIDDFLAKIPATPNTYKGRYESDKIEMVVDVALLELK